MRKPLLVALAIFSFLYSCTKIQSTDIGNGLIPPIDGVITKDTMLEVFTTTHLDSNITRVYKSDEYVIGSITNDALFGKTHASAYFELKPLFYKYFFPGTAANLVADSAVLVLSYRGAYGDTSVTAVNQAWKVFEINVEDTLKYDSVYNSENKTIRTTTLLGSKNFDPRRLGDSVNYGFENAKNQIRIRLTDAFAQRLIKQYDSSNAYASNTDFRSKFGGFAVIPDAGTGNALIRVSLTDTNTKLSLYYSYKTDTGRRESTVSYFKFRLGGDQTSGSANLIKRDRSGTPVNAAISNPTNNDDVVYVQTTPGTFAKVRIPGLAGLPNSLIHRAELIAQQVPENDPQILTMTPPRYLLLSAYDSTNKIKINIPNDYQIEGNNAPNYDYFGGILSYKTAGAERVAAYNFNISRYVQGIVSRKDKNYALIISAPANDSIKYTPPYPATIANTYYIAPVTANHTADGRVRLGGGSNTNPEYKMRLRIIYSRL